MAKNDDKKPITLDDLAKQMAEGFKKSDERYEELTLMVANGFNDVTSRMALKENTATKEDIATVGTEMTAMVTRLKTEIEALRNSVNNYLKLSDERYLELKYRQDIIVGWIAKLAEKSDVQLDLKELEYK